LPAVFAEKLHKTYFTRAGNVDALRGIDLSIEAGEFVAIMGPSGCGKTTLLNCLSGLDKPDKGKVLVDGIAIHELRDRELSEFRARKMGFVFQSFDLIPELLGGSSPKEARRAAEAILQKLGMADRLHHRPTQLSGGEQQRVAIARAVVHRPAVVWADEPTGNLDSANSKSVMRLLSQLNSEGQTIVVVTHDPEVAGVAKRRLVMRDGQIVSDET
jgi:putative ABC transport system ATP-binding protein